MKISIRPFQQTDSDDLWNLHVLTVLAAGFSQEVAEWDTDLHSIHQSYVEKGGHFIVATDVKGQLIAMGGYLPTDVKSIELKRMRVHPKFQKNGVGKAVLSELEASAFTAGFRRAHLDTANEKAKAFYERNGYQFIKQESEGSFEFYFFEKSLQRKN